MSDLWDYDDDDGHDNSGGWAVAPPDVDDCKKRKGRNKAGVAGKRRVDLPAQDFSFQPVPIPNPILVDSDEHDDLVLLPSPEAQSDRYGKTGTSGGTGCNPGPRAAAAAALTPATQESLTREQELLRALQQVTEREDEQDDDFEPCPSPTVSRLSHLGLTHLGSRLPTTTATIAAVNKGLAADLREDDGVLVAAEGPAPAATDDVVTSHCIQHQAMGAARDEDGKAGAAEPAPVLAVDRVQLRLVWGRDKEQSIRMRVAKKEPFSKMLAKFRQIAQDKSLCRDASKIK